MSIKTRIIFLLFIFVVFNLILLIGNNLSTVNITLSAQSKFFFEPQNAFIAIISEPDGFTKTNISSEILKGILAIKKEFPISVLLLTPESYENTKEEILYAINSKANIIITSGEENRDTILSLALENPDTFFIGVDMFSNDLDINQFIKKPTPRNLNFLLYKEEEAGFLAGIFAGLITKDYSSITNKLNAENIVGIIIANKNDSKDRYEFGFRLGVLAINDKCSILSNQLDDENDFYLIRKFTTNLYQNSADLVFQLCGQGSAAAIQSAYLNGNLIIGYEFDQNIYAPSNVITSAIKKISSSVYYYIKKSFLIGFISGVLRLGIKDGAVGLASFHEFDLLIPNQIKDAIYTASTSIAEGKITIPFVSMTLKEEDISFENKENQQSTEQSTQQSDQQLEQNDDNSDDQTSDQTSEENDESQQNSDQQPGDNQTTDQNNESQQDKF